MGRMMNLPGSVTRTRVLFVPRCSILTPLSAITLYEPTDINRVNATKPALFKDASITNFSHLFFAKLNNTELIVFDIC